MDDVQYPAPSQGLILVGMYGKFGETTDYDRGEVCGRRRTASPHLEIVSNQIQSGSLSETYRLDFAAINRLQDRGGRESLECPVIRPRKKFEQGGEPGV